MCAFWVAMVFVSFVAGSWSVEYSIGKSKRGWTGVQARWLKSPCDDEAGLISSAHWTNCHKFLGEAEIEFDETNNGQTDDKEVSFKGKGLAKVWEKAENSTVKVKKLLNPSADVQASISGFCQISCNVLRCWHQAIRHQ